MKESLESASVETSSSNWDPDSGVGMSLVEGKNRKGVFTAYNTATVGRSRAAQLNHEHLLDEMLDKGVSVE